MKVTPRKSNGMSAKTPQRLSRKLTPRKSNAMSAKAPRVSMKATPWKSTAMSAKSPIKTPGRIRSKRTPARSPIPILNASSAGNALKGGEGIIVAIRVRPLHKNESDHSRVWKALPKFTSVTQTTVEGKPFVERILNRNFFTFDKTFDEDSSTEAVYTSVAKNIVLSACTGLNGTIFAYGQTSSGKTYTMQGSGTIAEGSVGASGGGIVHMAAQDVFSYIAANPDRTFTVRVSFLEIYNEEVRDLLDDSRPLQIREDPRRGFFVQAKEEIVTEFSNMLGILFQGEKSRAFASTAMNERSSRSHTIFRITIESRTKLRTDDDGDGVDSVPNTVTDQVDGAMRISTLNLVDLAGSESVRHTGATGDRQKEGGMINQSLLTLSRVMQSLGTPHQGHINFRDSKLTRILQPSLTGNARMAVICCIMPSERYLEETRSTLQFAQRAKLIKMNPRVNELLDDGSNIQRLQQELAEQMEHVQSLVLRASKAEQEAVQANKKLRQMQEAMFANRRSAPSNGTDQISSASESVKVARRLRRLSESCIADIPGTPGKIKREGSTPATVPRLCASTSFEAVEPISALSEIDILWRALASKSANMTKLQERYSALASDQQSTERQLIASGSDALELQSSVDSPRDQDDRLSGERGAVKSELDETIENQHRLPMAEMNEALALERKDHKAAIALIESLRNEKQNLELEGTTTRESNSQEILKLKHQIDAQQSEIDLLKSQNEELHSVNEAKSVDLNSLTLQISTLTEEMDRSLQDKGAVIDVLRKSIQSNEEEIVRLNDIASIITAERDEVEAAKAAALHRVEGLTEQVQRMSSEMGALKEKNIDLERKISSAEKKLVEAKALAEAANGEISSLKDLLRAQDEALDVQLETNRSLEVAQKSAEAEEEQPDDRSTPSSSCCETGLSTSSTTINTISEHPQVAANQHQRPAATLASSQVMLELTATKSTYCDATQSQNNGSGEQGFDSKTTSAHCQQRDLAEHQRELAAAPPSLSTLRKSPHCRNRITQDDVDEWGEHVWVMQGKTQHMAQTVTKCKEGRNVVAQISNEHDGNAIYILVRWETTRKFEYVPLADCEFDPITVVDLKNDHRETTVHQVDCSVQSSLELTLDDDDDDDDDDGLPRRFLKPRKARARARELLTTLSKETTI